MRIRNYILALILITLTLLSCSAKTSSMIPPDDTPVWAENRRYAVEQENTCNTTQYSIGLSGCVYTGSSDEQLIIPEFPKSDLFFESSNCQDFSIANEGNGTIVIPLSEIYTNEKQENCSFEIIRRVYKGDDYYFDNLMLGRFFIKNIQKSPYYAPLKFSVAHSEFSGVGWYQLHHKELPPVINITPEGKTGRFLMYCGDKLVTDVEFKDSPFHIVMAQESEACDYEMAVSTVESPKLEFGTFIYEKQTFTIDLTTPRVYVKKGRFYFSFRDKNKKGKYVVAAVEVNGLRRLGHYYWAKKGQDAYTVKGVTSSGRLFVGSYYPETEKWEVK